MQSKFSHASEYQKRVWFESFDPKKRTDSNSFVKKRIIVIIGIMMKYY